MRAFEGLGDGIPENPGNIPATPNEYMGGGGGGGTSFSIDVSWDGISWDDVKAGASKAWGWLKSVFRDEAKQVVKDATKRVEQKLARQKPVQARKMTAAQLKAYARQLLRVRPYTDPFLMWYYLSGPGRDDPGRPSVYTRLLDLALQQELKMALSSRAGFPSVISEPTVKKASITSGLGSYSVLAILAVVGWMVFK